MAAQNQIIKSRAANLSKDVDTRLIQLIQWKIN